MEPMTRMKAVRATAAIDLIVFVALGKLRWLVAAVNRPGEESSEIGRALDVLRTLSQKEAIPIAIVGDVAAIRHGYERLTNNLDVVIARLHQDTIICVAPQYGIKVSWHDPNGWHKLQFEGLKIEVVPEGAKPSKNAPTTIPGPSHLGVAQGLGYANMEGWVETKLGAGRRQDQADIVQVLKNADPEAIESIRAHVAKVHYLYSCLFEELVTAAEEEKQQEGQRGGPR
jgi:hypothetical protein